MIGVVFAVAGEYLTAYLVRSLADIEVGLEIQIDFKSLLDVAVHLEDSVVEDLSGLFGVEADVGLGNDRLVGGTPDIDPDPAEVEILRNAAPGLLGQRLGSDLGSVCRRIVLLLFPAGDERRSRQGQ